MTWAWARLGNWAHRQPNVFVRRSVLLIAIAGMALSFILWWLVMAPLLWIAAPIILGLIEFGKTVISLPQQTINQAVNDWRDWKVNFVGARKVWAAQKVEPTIQTGEGL